VEERGKEIQEEEPSVASPVLREKPRREGRGKGGGKKEKKKKKKVDDHRQEEWSVRDATRISRTRKRAG